MSDALGALDNSGYLARKKSSLRTKGALSCESKKRIFLEIERRGQCEFSRIDNTVTPRRAIVVYLDNLKVPIFKHILDVQLYSPIDMISPNLAFIFYEEIGVIIGLVVDRASGIGDV